MNNISTNNHSSTPNHLLPRDLRLRDIPVINPYLPSEQLSQLIIKEQNNRSAVYLSNNISAQRQIDLKLRVDEIATIKDAELKFGNEQDILAEYRRASVLAFLGEGTYTIRLTQPSSWEMWGTDVVIGPSITCKEVLKALHPELAQNFKEIDEAVYNELRAEIKPCSPKHFADLVGFADAHGLERPAHRFAQSTTITKPLSQKQASPSLAHHSPYSLTKEQCQQVAKAQQKHMNEISIPNRFIAAQHFDSNMKPINNAEEFFNIVTTFQKTRSAHDNMDLEYYAFMSQAMASLSSEMRANADEMIKLIEQHPEAYYEISPDLLNKDFITRMVGVSPITYHELVRDSKLINELAVFEDDPLYETEVRNLGHAISQRSAECLYNAAEATMEDLDHYARLHRLTQYRAVINAHLQAATTQVSRYDIQPLDCNGATQYFCPLDIHTQQNVFKQPYWNMQPLKLYEQLSRQAFAGKGVYDTNMDIPSRDAIDNSNIWGPVITMKALLRDANPDLEESFDAMDIKFYKLVGMTSYPISERHESDLINFADAHGLRPPVFHWEQDLEPENIEIDRT